jgi:hypothetical protein
MRGTLCPYETEKKEGPGNSLKPYIKGINLIHEARAFMD